MSRPDLVALLDRRAGLLEAGPSDELDAVTEDLRAVLSGARPVLRRLTGAPGDDDGGLLERLAAQEPVHPVVSAEDLRDRVDEDRRCFVLEHPALRGRPFNVVWVALWRGIPTDLWEILDPGAPVGDPSDADTAVFYSIWSVEPGLVGFPGGGELIERAGEALRAELPRLRTLVTLSPVPGFREWWLERHGEGAGPDEHHDRHEDALLAECAEYLVSRDGDGRLLDPVARFHLRNGARLFALQRHGDRSERGQGRSFGIMANYRYEPEDRAENRRLLAQGRVALGEDVPPPRMAGPDGRSR